MPMSGQVKTDDVKRASTFSHSKEIVKPNYYQVWLEDHKIKAEMSPSTRGCMMRFTFDQKGQNFLVFDASKALAEVKIFPEQKRIEGYTTINSGGVRDNFATYFVLQFDQPFKSFGTWQNENLNNKQKALKGNNIGAYLEFETSQTNQVNVQIATSFISVEQTKRNLQSELGSHSLEEITQEGQKIWNQHLGKIEIEGASPQQLTTFYSCLYRTLLFPRIWYEFDENNKPYHYSPQDGQIHTGVMYADTGFWDTFRAQFPLLTLLFPEKNQEMIQGFINTYQEGDWLPKWPSPGQRNSMIGAHAVSIINDAYQKGIRTFDINLAYEAILKDALATPPHFELGGRSDNQMYLEKGYLASNITHEATSKTLEYAYSDFCVARLAETLGKKTDADYFYKNAFNYQNVFNSHSGWMQGRKDDGSWQANFDPTEWGGAFTEGGSWHYTWSVMHDPKGLMDIMGGKVKFVRRMDSLFKAPSIFKVGSYGNTIHEMSEMVAINMGQYAHNNQPMQHFAYLYNYAQQPWKTQQIVREILNKLYKPTPDGYFGDEDNGQTSAWYIFSALGFYPVCPGTSEYIIGSPLFKKVTIHLPNGRDFVIESLQNTPQNYYIQEVTLNSKPLKTNWLSHHDIIKGGSISFSMGNKPNFNWGSDSLSTPYSMSKVSSVTALKNTKTQQPAIKATTPTPEFKNTKFYFYDDLEVKLNCSNPAAKIYYTLDGSLPTNQSLFYQKPFKVNKTNKVKAIAYAPSSYKSSITQQIFAKIPKGYLLNIAPKPHPKYIGSGEFALIDGLLGSSDFTDGNWVGFEKNDCEINLDLGKSFKLQNLNLNFLQNHDHLIFLPIQVEVMVADNTMRFETILKNEFKNEGKIEGAEIQAIRCQLPAYSIRYIKLKIKNRGKSPEFARLPGANTWVFLDEIQIQ
jgi:predicted alpha-1,2-mannosidase